MDGELDQREAKLLEHRSSCKPKLFGERQSLPDLTSVRSKGRLLGHYWNDKLQIAGSPVPGATAAPAPKAGFESRERRWHL